MRIFGWGSGLCIGIAVSLLLVVPASCGRKQTSLPLIRVGWQTSWATQAQLAMVLKHTNIPELNGLRVELRGFQYGGPLGEAALAGQIDTLFAADQPAINLIARGAKWKIVSKCIGFRDALMVPAESSAKGVADLRGKKIAVPFGSGAHRIVIELVKEAGLDVQKDVTLVNLDAAEINATVQGGVVDKEKQTWRGEIAAVASWDPSIAQFEDQKIARTLVEKRLFGVTAMSEDFMKANPKAAEVFLRVLHMALWYYGKHPEQADTWYTQEINISLKPAILRRSASYDENLGATTPGQIDLSLSEADIAVLQASSDFAFGSGLIKTHPVAKSASQNGHAERARRKQIMAQANSTKPR
jgi:ABC-type nitrate/sulfonate/bicarbonate transport system substrate-binding protein